MNKNEFMSDFAIGKCWSSKVHQGVPFSANDHLRDLKGPYCTPFYQTLPHPKHPNTETKLRFGPPAMAISMEWNVTRAPIKCPKITGSLYTCPYSFHPKKYMDLVSPYKK